MSLTSRLAEALHAVMEQADAPALCGTCSGGVESPIDTERLTAAYAALTEYDTSMEADVAYLNKLPLAEALWWFIENVSPDHAHRTLYFFTLRERYRNEFATKDPA